MLQSLTAEEILPHFDSREKLSQELIKYLVQKTILGIDIYKYSQYEITEQILIPVVFDNFYRDVINNLLRTESFFFKGYGETEKDFRKNFISTGDGGFQILDNPIQAILFAFYFQAGVKRFVTKSVSGTLGKKLRQIIEQIELRYAMTTDLIYAYNNNFYGPGIITNARILSKDSLNRLLIDANTYKWFNNQINGVENLIDINIKKLKKTGHFPKYDDKLKSFIFSPDSKITSADVLKIGAIEAKATSLNIYNLHLQASVDMNIVAEKKYNTFITTLGNLNTTGIQ